MHAIREVEGGIALNALQKKRIERDAILLLKARVDGIEGLAVGLAVVARGIHAGKQHRDPACFQTG